MKVLFAFLVILHFSPARAQTNSIAPIRFDGLYETECIVDEYDDEGSTDFLRFYPDGKVITVGTDCKGRTAKLRKWFHIGADQVSTGAYVITGLRISFTTTSGMGTVAYDGEMTDSLITLSWKSSINGEDGTSVYKFLPLKRMK